MEATLLLLIEGPQLLHPVPPTSSAPLFSYDSTRPCVSGMKTTLTPVGFFSFSIPKSALVQWVDLLLLLRAPWLCATAGKIAAQTIF